MSTAHQSGTEQGRRYHQHATDGLDPVTTSRDTRAHTRTPTHAHTHTHNVTLYQTDVLFIRYDKQANDVFELKINLLYIYYITMEYK